MRVADKEVSITGKFFKIARLEQEWYEDLEDPAKFIEKLRNIKPKPDIFTFWQRLPNVEPLYEYPMEMESIAVLPITTFDHWWKKQVNAKTRNVARKAEKKGVEIKVVEFDDDFVNGLVNIFNETPERQGKPFWHYNKGFEIIKQEFSRYIFREDMIAAYYEGEMIGFIMLAYAGEFAITAQILSMIKHRDKSPTNALLAKAVEICAEKKLKYLNYAMCQEGTLGKFKKHNGFKKFDMPRYYVPLTLKGQGLMKTGVHKGAKNLIPEQLRLRLKQVRSKVFAKDS